MVDFVFVFAAERPSDVARGGSPWEPFVVSSLGTGIESGELPEGRPMRFILTTVAALIAAQAGTATEPDDKAVRAAVTKAIPRLWEGIDGHTERRSCFTCHSHAVPLVALTIARDRGFAVDAKKLAAQVDFALKDYETLRPRAKGTDLPVGGGVDNSGYATFALAALGVKPNKTTEMLASYTLGFQAKNDHWGRGSGRFPSQASGFTTTYLSMVSLREYGAAADAKKIDARIARARAWLLKTPAKDTEDRAFKLLALRLAGGTEAEIEVVRKELLDTQRPDGGFAQTEKMEPDAYATGTALYALHRGGQVKTSDAAYRKGLTFLLKTQKDDGTWHVKTHSRPVQRFFESGFPYGKDQFISCAATGWATAALALSLTTK